MSGKKLGLNDRYKQLFKNITSPGIKKNETTLSINPMQDDLAKMGGMGSAGTFLARRATLSGGKVMKDVMSKTKDPKSLTAPKKVTMVAPKPTVGGKQLKTTEINTKGTTAKLQKEFGKYLKTPGYLTGGQTKIDANKDGKITGEDFKILKANKKTNNKDNPEDRFGKYRTSEAKYGKMMNKKPLKANVGLLAKLASNKGATAAGLLGLGMLAKKKFSTGGENKIKKVMGEFKDKTLKSSSGKKVTSKKQAIAIALSEARKKQKSGKRKA